MNEQSVCSECGAVGSLESVEFPEQNVHFDFRSRESKMVDTGNIVYVTRCKNCGDFRSGVVPDVELQEQCLKRDMNAFYKAMGIDKTD